MGRSVLGTTVRCWWVVRCSPGSPVARSRSPPIVLWTRAIVVGPASSSPNVHTMVGQLYQPDLPAGFRLHPLLHGDQPGGVLAPAVVRLAGGEYQWSYGFAAASPVWPLDSPSICVGVSMLQDVGLPPQRHRTSGSQAAGTLTPIERRRIAAIGIMRFLWGSSGSASSRQGLAKCVRREPHRPYPQPSG